MHPYHPAPPRGHEARRTRPSQGGRARAGQAEQAGHTRRGTAHEERKTSEPMRQDRASRAPHKSRATTERRPAAAEARQASSSSHARGHRQTIKRESFPAIRPAAHHVEHDAEPLAHRSPSMDAGQSHPERLAPSAGKAGRQEERGAQPPEQGRRPRQDQPTSATRATPANHSTGGSSPPPIHTERPEPMTVRDRTARQTPHQRPPEAAGATRGRQATRDSRRPRQSGRRPHKSPSSPTPTSLRDKSRRRTKEKARRPRKDGRPPARAVCVALVSGPRVYGDRVQTIARNQTQVIAADIRHLRQQVSGWS